MNVIMVEINCLRSDRLWDHYIKFELECKQYSRVTDIYERLIATPTHGFLNNFEW